MGLLDFLFKPRYESGKDPEVYSIATKGFEEANAIRDIAKAKAKIIRERGCIENHKHIHFHGVDVKEIIKKKL